jgi:hypothetical protein
MTIGFPFGASWATIADITADEIPAFFNATRSSADK